MAVIIQNAIKFSQKGRTFYLGWLSLKDIRDCVFVPTKRKTMLSRGNRTPLEEREEGGYNGMHRYRDKKKFNLL